MNREIEEATERVKDAQIALGVKSAQVYPIGKEVVVKMGGREFHLRVTGHPNPFWASRCGEIYGENVKTGKGRNFYDHNVIEVLN